MIRTCAPRSYDHSGQGVRSRAKISTALTLLLASSLPAHAADPLPLELDLGRSEVRVYAAPCVIPVGRTVEEARLPERLERLGYSRVKGRKPEKPGQYFWGNESFWIYRQTHHFEGAIREAALVGLRLDGPAGRILGPGAHPGEAASRVMPYLEPETLAESLTGDRAPRRPIRLAQLPERVWRPLLAIEDARFFEHPGVDYRGIARAILANILKGGVAQGGSTITQQLIKMRDLTPKRTLGRKVSEAVRALAIESEYDKKEILESYLNHVYYGHLGGVSIHGLGAAARAFFSKRPAELTLSEAALLAGIIQAPNRLAPDRHPAEAKKRRDRVLQRMGELKWASAAEVAAAQRSGLGLKLNPPPPPPANQFLGWVSEIAHEEAERRLENGRGVLVETGIDPLVQEATEEAVRHRLEALRKSFKRLRGAPLSAAAVALDAETGAVLAYVGGDPDAPRGGFDRARKAQRQPGSAIKPLVLLEAFESCGSRGALYPATRVLDAPVAIQLPKGPWKPANHDGNFRGLVTVREALAQSLNTPLVRLGRWCGFEAVATTLRRAGITLPAEPPPSFVLGAVETSPLALAQAYTVFATPGETVKPRPVLRIDRPDGWNLAKFKLDREPVVRPAVAWLVRDLMREAVASGTGRGASLKGLDVAGKTGSSSNERDAWFAGQAGSVVAVVWVGLDNDDRLGLSGAEAAAPLWRELMAVAARVRGGDGPERPSEIVEAWVDLSSGLLVNKGKKAHRDLFRRGTLPRKDRWWWFDAPERVIR